MSRVSIGELLTQRRLEPSIRQVVVEGALDARFYRWLFKCKDRARASFTHINSIEVSSSIVVKHGQPLDNHGRLIALGLELYELDPNVHQGVLCLADGEFDYLLDRIQNTPTIQYLDATSPECLILDEDSLEKFCIANLASNAPDSGQVLAAVSDCLRRLFSLRAANWELGFGLQWPGVSAKTGDDGTVAFDEKLFVDRYVSSVTELVSPTTLKTRAMEIFTFGIGLPIEKAVRGHDIPFVLGPAIRGHLRKDRREMWKPENCESALRCCLDREALMRRAPLIHVQRFLQGVTRFDP